MIQRSRRARGRTSVLLTTRERRARADGAIAGPRCVAARISRDARDKNPPHPRSGETGDGAKSGAKIGAAATMKAECDCDSGGQTARWQPIGDEKPAEDCGFLAGLVAQTGEVSKSQTPLRASFRIRLNGEPVVIETIGQAYRFITSLNTVEWMEFKALHADAKAALKAAAEDAMLSVKATNTLRELFVRAKLL